MKARTIAVLSLCVAGTVAGTAVAAAPSKYGRPAVNTRASVTSSGQQAQYLATSAYDAGWSDLSADGRYVVWEGRASNMGGNTLGAFTVFWRDTKTGKTVQVPQAVGGGAPEVRTGIVALSPSISRDGRYVAFASGASDLVAGDTNGQGDVFVRDMKTGETELASVASTGAQANGPSMQPSLSADGRHVAFHSYASNLVSGDTNGASDVFVRDLKSGRTVRASVATDGTQANAGSGNPSLSGDGRYVAFMSDATNLGSGNFKVSRVFWHDTRTGQTRQVSVSSDGTEGSYAIFPSCTVSIPILAPPAPQSLPDPLNVAYRICGSQLLGNGRYLSDDGRYVTFASNATNLVPNDTNYTTTQPVRAGGPGYDVFVRDVVGQRTERASVDAYGHELVNANGVWVATSSEGRYISYTAQVAQNCIQVGSGVGVPPLPAVGCPITAIGELGTSETFLGFLYDRMSGVMEQTSVSSTGGQPMPGPCSGSDRSLKIDRQYTWAGSVTPGGRYVSMNSCAQNLVPGDTNRGVDIIVRDRGAQLGASTYAGSAATPSSGGTTQTCVLSICPPGAADLLASRVVARPAMGDLFFRWDVSRMAPVAGPPAGGLLYELRFTSGGQHYAVRAQRTPGPDFDTSGGASFGLFRETLPDVWTHVASLKGGYGTAGDAVVAAVPLSLLGGKAQLTDVTAYTAVGSYLSGTTKVLDSLRLSR